MCRELQGLLQEDVMRHRKFCSQDSKVEDQTSPKRMWDKHLEWRGWTALRGRSLVRQAVL